MDKQPQEIDLTKVVEAYAEQLKNANHRIALLQAILADKNAKKQSESEPINISDRKEAK